MESETEEDRVFLDYEEIEEQSVSFYWNLQCQFEDKSDCYEGNVDEKPEDHSPQSKQICPGLHPNEIHIPYD